MSAHVSSSLVSGCTGLPQVRRWSMSHTCSIGLMSGDRAGQSIRCIPSRSSYCLATKARLGRALSSMRIKPGPTARA